MSNLFSILDRKLSYKFQEKDNRDHIFYSEKNIKDNSEIYKISIPLKNNTVSKVVGSSANNFVIPNLPQILDQRNIGSCVANSFAFCICCQTGNKIISSRLYHYINSRLLDFTPLIRDDGTTIRTACKAISRYGVVAENLLPYVTSNFSIFPTLSIYQSAKLFKSFSYTFVNQDLISIKNCLNNFKAPIIFGVLIYSSFMTREVATTGMVPMPNLTKDRNLGGHCMNIVGYNDNTKMFTCVNSWGSNWGNKGLCYIPYAYLLNTRLAADFCFLQIIQ